MFRNDEYGGGVEALLAPCDVDGRLNDGAGLARRSLDEARSWRPGEPERDRGRESSFNRLMRSFCSNCFVRSRAQSAPYGPSAGGAGGCLSMMSRLTNPAGNRILVLDKRRVYKKSGTICEKMFQL
jgi:hypothetical protein